MDVEDFARICLDPVRLAALGRGVEGSLTVDTLSDALGITRREALETVGNLRLAKLIDDRGNLVLETLHVIASTLPKPLAASEEITAGDWSETEKKVLETFFTGDRLREIPTQHSKRRVVLERLAQEFEPGSRYDERTVSERLGVYHDDYAALRRYLVDEGILTRAEGMYWRSGGRIPPDDRSRSTSPTATVPDRTPQLVTDDPRVVLEPFSSRHRRELLEAANNEAIRAHMDDLFPYPYTPDDADQWITECAREEPPMSFAIVVDGVLAGAIGCAPGTGTSRGSGDVGWWLNPAWWGRGFASAAARRLIRYCFDDLGMHRVQASTAIDNPASARVAEKAGLEIEGIARGGYAVGGRVVDRIYYGLARKDTGVA